MLFGALLKDQWTTVLSECMRVLKPGGYIQLAEMDISKVILGGPASRRQSELVVEMLKKEGMVYDIAQRLPQMLHDAGFENIVSELKYGPTGKSWGKMGELGTMSNAGAFKRLMPGLVGGGLITDQEMTRVYEESLKEFETMEGTRFVYHMICARKPL